MRSPFFSVSCCIPPLLQPERRLPLEDVEAGIVVFDLEQRMRRPPIELLDDTLDLDEAVRFVGGIGVVCR